VFLLINHETRLTGAVRAPRHCNIRIKRPEVRARIPPTYSYDVVQGKYLRGGEKKNDDDDNNNDLGAPVVFVFTRDNVPVMYNAYTVS
jgi:hypothetical protein